MRVSDGGKFIKIRSENCVTKVLIEIGQDNRSYNLIFISLLENFIKK